MELGLRISYVRAHALPIAKVFTVDFFKCEGRLAIDLGDHAVLLLEDGGKFGTEGVYVEQVSHADADTRVFIDVSRGDAALRAADLICSPGFFLEPIKQEVIGHDDVRAFADKKPGDIYTLIL